MAQLITDMKLKDTNEQDYFSIDLSLKIFDKWCNNLGIDKNQFVTDLFNVLHKREPKINTFCIHGPQNTGKSYILRSIREIVKYYGEIHAGDSSAFQFESCIRTKMIFIEEPTFTREHLEQMKLVMESTPTKVKVKNKSDQLLRPPPVIITTNNTLWKNASSQKGPCMARMKYYEVTTEQQWLLHLKKNLNPKIWPTLFETHLKEQAEKLDEDKVAQLIGSRTPETRPQRLLGRIKEFCT